MEYKQTAHKERMFMFNEYAKGKSVEDVARETSNNPATVRFVINRLLGLAWQSEGREGECPGVRQLKKIGMWTEIVLVANRNEKFLEENYGRRGSSTGYVIRPESLWDRIVNWLKGIFK